MIDFVKLEDLAHRCIHIVRDLEEREILRRNQTEFEEMLGQKPHPSLPVSATGPIEQHNRDNPRLAGLHQSDDLESLIHRSEAARKKSKRVRFLHEVEFAREEVIEIDQLRIAFDHFIRLLLERQTNVQTKTVLSSRTALGCPHDTLPAAGDEYVVIRNHCSREIFSDFRFWRIRRGACRSTVGNFSDLRVALQYFRSITDFFEGTID